MGGLPPEIETIDTELAELEPAFNDLARKRAGLLRRKLAALDTLLRERQQIQEALNKLGPLLQEGDSDDAEARTASPAIANVVPREFSNLSVWEATREVLRRERREMLSRELAESLSAGGRNLSAGNGPAHVNSSISAKKDVFYRAKRRGKLVWGLVEWRDEKGEGLTPGLQV